MRKLISDGEAFLSKETDRVKKIQEGKITKEKKGMKRPFLLP
jgi:hypothetical protein